MAFERGGGVAIQRFAGTADERTVELTPFEAASSVSTGVDPAPAAMKAETTLGSAGWTACATNLGRESAREAGLEALLDVDPAPAAMKAETTLGSAGWTACATNPGRESAREAFLEALLDTDRQAARRVLESACQLEGIAEALESLVRPVLERIGTQWEAGELALSRVYMSGRICEELIEILQPDQGGHGAGGEPRVAMGALEDLAEVKRACAGRLTVIGNLNGIEMRRWTLAQAEAAVKEAITMAAPGGGFILADNLGEIPWQVPGDTLMAIAEAARRWGEYPIRCQHGE